MSGPSEKAIHAADLGAFPGLPFDADQAHRRVVAALNAAHDPALGRDRSVCLRDVMAELWSHGPAGAAFAEILEREFGSES